MKRSHLGIVVLVIVCASFWVVATHPIFAEVSVHHAPNQAGGR